MKAHIQKILAAIYLFIEDVCKYMYTDGLENKRYNALCI